MKILKTIYKGDIRNDITIKKCKSASEAISFD